MHNRTQINLGRRHLAFLTLLLIQASAPVFAQTPWPATLRVQAARLADVGYRIGRTAAPLCPAQAAGTGLALDYIGAYKASDRAAVSALLDLNGFPQVAAVAADSPAVAAGVRIGDAVLAVNGTDFATMLAASPDPSLFADELEQRLADSPLGVPLVLTLERESRAREVRITPVAVCTGRFVIKIGGNVSAYTDGRNIAITTGLINFTHTDDELALVAGHEAGHIIYGDGANDGANGRERRMMEDRADALSVQLVKCAGYDLNAAFRYRLRRAAAQPLDFLLQGDHRPSRARVARMRALAPSVTCPPAR